MGTRQYRDAAVITRPAEAQATALARQMEATARMEVKARRMEVGARKLEGERTTVAEVAAVSFSHRRSS